MKRSEIETKISLLKLELEEVTKERKENQTDQIEAKLFIRHKALSKEIADLEWELKSSKEKNDHRKAVLNMGMKWGSMKGTNETEHNSSLPLVVALCDVALELLDRNDLDDQFKEKLQGLVAFIDTKRIP